jgi:hypothetical protein
MYRIGALAVILFLLCSAAAHAGVYEDLLAKLKAGEVNIDYAALRYAWADTPDYDGYGDGPEGAREAMIAAFNARDCDQALPHAHAVLEAIYVDIDAHTVAGACYGQKFDLAKSAFHRAVARGLEKSILDSGDGKSPKTAYIAVRISEEYHVLRSLNLRLSMQSLVNADGHAYDRMSAKDESGKEVVVYFQIDRVLAGLERQFKDLGQSP